MSSRHVMIDGWVIDKNKSRKFVHGRLMVDDFSAKEFHNFVARVNRKKGMEILLSFLHFCR